MTKDFSNERRDDDRQSFSRQTSSGNYRQERSSQSARPRLSREAVDRAWENGAPRKYADYRPRQTSNTSPVHQQGRPSSTFERSHSSQNNRGYEPRRQEPFHGQSSSSAPRQPYQERYQPGSETGGRRLNERGNHAPGARPSFNGERDVRNQPQERYNGERGPQSRNTAGRPNDRNGNERRPMRQGGRDEENFAYGRRTGGPGARRNHNNPRWESRPNAQRNYQPARQEDAYTSSSSQEQFHGDYERFNHYERGEQPRRTERPERTPEKHFTPTRDGRVLKGSRPSQRTQERFWNQVAEETDTLIPQPPQPPQEQSQTTRQPEKSGTRPARSRPASARRTRPAKTVQTTHSDDQEEGQVIRKKKARGPQGPVTRPSKRGYKWPTTGE